LFRRKLYLPILLYFIILPVQAEIDNAVDLFELSLEELGNISVASSSTLTQTEERLVPAAVTQILRENIAGSGARTLNELLQIYVPGFQLIRHHFGGSHIGTRGFISGADNYFILVNGRPINKRSETGAITERDLMLLSDIDHIEVIRGPGSAIYGMGAESMVISITTFNGKTFQGTEARARAHEGQDRYSFEAKHGASFGEDGSFFLYGGISEVPGASKDDAPYIFGRTFTSKDGIDVVAGEPANTLYSRSGAAYQTPIKLHAELTWKDFEAWVRYSRGGEDLDNRISEVAAAPVGNATPLTTDIGNVGYQQVTVNLDYKQTVSDTWQLDYHLSYDMTDYERFFLNRADLDTRQTSHREDMYLARVLAHWVPDDRFTSAVGLEFSHNEYGLKSPGFPDKAPSSSRFIDGMPRWDTQTWSGMFETQWRINNKWTSFLGARIDKHTYSDTLFSPRVALIHTPTEKDTLKLIFSRSNLVNYADNLKKGRDAGSGNAEPETLDNIELRYERNHTEQLFAAISVYYQQLEATGFDLVSNDNVKVGEQEQAGVEVELSYQGDHFQLGLSHQFHKLIDFNLDPVAKSTFVTAAPFGFGNDLDSWSNHISKIDASYDLSNNWRAHGNLQYLWGYPGTEDQVNFRNSTRATNAKLTDPGWDDTFEKSVFLNLGLEYKLKDTATINLVGYHLLGLIDEDLNKQNYLGGFGGYRNLAPSIGLNTSWEF
jgi:TonB-dependent Receptor Plug Domain